MRVVAAGSSFPQYRYRQAEITAALRQAWAGKLSNPGVLDRLHSHCGVSYRHLTLPLEAYGRVDSFGKANDIWIETAEQLGSSAICRAITPAGIQPRDLDALFF